MLAGEKSNFFLIYPKLGLTRDFDAKHRFSCLIFKPSPYNSLSTSVGIFIRWNRIHLRSIKKLTRFLKPFGRDPQPQYFVDQSHRTQTNFADFYISIG
jgi:hypothetical protein